MIKLVVETLEGVVLIIKSFSRESERVIEAVMPYVIERNDSFKLFDFPRGDKAKLVTFSELTIKNVYNPKFHESPINHEFIVRKNTTLFFS